MMPGDYYAAVDGYNMKQRGEQERFRRLAYISLIPHMKDGYNYQRFCADMWSLAGDKYETIEKMLIPDDEIQNILKVHNFGKK